MTFSDLGLAEPFLLSLKQLGYKQATPIQTKAIPVVLAGRDLVGCAQTGTGKTAAFTLPMLDRLMQTSAQRTNSQPPKKQRGRRQRCRPLRALILTPTRELAAQIGESIARYGKHTSLRHGVIFGGVSQFHQVRALQKGLDVLVATPGRLIDLMEQGYVDLSRVEVLVLDEADQMLDIGFLPPLKRIVSKVPVKRQTLMFSATMSPEIRQLATEWLQRPRRIEVTPVATPADKIAQTVHMVEKPQKVELLLKFLAETPRGRTLVFSRTKHGADKIVRRLQRNGLSAAAIHGNKSQNARTRTLEQFKGNDPPILVATDIAARGLDIRGVSHIVNFDLPETPETYVHRIGRTARAGAEGVAISFCASEETRYLRQIEKLMKRRIEVEQSSRSPASSASHRTEGAPRPKPRRKPRGPRARSAAR